MARFALDHRALRRTAQSVRWTHAVREVRVVRFTQRGRVYLLVDPAISDDLFEENVHSLGDMAPLAVFAGDDRLARWFFDHHRAEEGFDPDAEYRHLDRRALPLDHPRTRRCLADWQRALVRMRNGRRYRGWGSRVNVWGGA